MNSRSTNFFYVEDFEGSGERLNIEVCADIMGITEDDADLMLVSVGFGESLCPPPTSATSSALVAIPTRLPTLVATTPDPVIQASGTLARTPGSTVSVAVVATTGPTLIHTHLPITVPTTRRPTRQPSAPDGSPEFPTAGPNWTPPTRLPTLVPTTPDPVSKWSAGSYSWFNCISSSIRDSRSDFDTYISTHNSPNDTPSDESTKCADWLTRIPNHRAQLDATYSAL
jgi:hypothetical protein